MLRLFTRANDTEEWLEIYGPHILPKNPDIDKTGVSITFNPNDSGPVIIPIKFGRQYLYLN